jgi:CRISPR-associated protein Cmr1
MKKFPRAAFGLPINFKFRDDDTVTHQPNRSDKDPRKTVLQPQDAQRLASPLILKPLACQDNKYIGLAVILEGTGIKKEKLLLKTQEGKPEEWKNLEPTLEKGQALRLTSFLPVINSKNDSLQTFFNLL